MRFEQNEPFPLYPGELPMGSMIPLQVVKYVKSDLTIIDHVWLSLTNTFRPNSALRLKATRDFVDRYASISQGKTVHSNVTINSTKFISLPGKAGDEWLFEGPATYFPQVEIDVIETVNAVIVKPGHALKLRAKCTLVDRNGTVRKSNTDYVG